MCIECKCVLSVCIECKVPLLGLDIRAVQPAHATMHVCVRVLIVAVCVVCSVYNCVCNVYSLHMCVMCVNVCVQHVSLCCGVAGQTR